MKFGVYIRDKREKKGWTQPEAAEKAEIEQSYLSKLETGKSHPSEETFNRLIAAYDIDLAQMSQQLFSGELDKLREIKQVRKVVLERQKSEVSVVRSWMVAGLACLMLGGALLGLALLSEYTMEYHYRSQGKILPGETLDVFDIIKQTQLSDEAETQRFDLKKQAMIDRIDQNDIISNTNRGDSFVEKVSDGKRHFIKYFQDQVRVDSKWLLAPALMFLLGSFGCFFISYRWK